MIKQTLHKIQDYDKSDEKKSKMLGIMIWWMHIDGGIKDTIHYYYKSLVKFCLEYIHSTISFIFFAKYIVILYLHVFGICKFLHDLFSNKKQTKVVLPETLNSASFTHKMAICQLFCRNIFLEPP